MRGRKRLTALIATLAVLLLVVLVWNHHPVGRFLMAQTLSVTTGYHVEIGEMRLQSDHGAFIDTHVTRGGERVLDAARIDIYYNLRDLLPGSTHRFGFVGLSINQPQLTIIHHKDGTYNIPQLRSSGGGAAAPTRANGTPLDFYARIRDGSATLIDDYQYYKEARLQTVHRINADFSTKSDVRTHYVVTAAFVDLKDEPLRAVGTIDYHHGYALHHIVAAAVPIKAIGNYVINSSAARIVAGTAKNFDTRIYALDVRPGMPINYHTSGTLSLSDGQLYINGLAKPLDNIRGGLQITDTDLAARALDATLAGVPLKVAGAIYNFSNPQFNFGIQGRGDMHDLKNIVAFGARYPLTGQTDIATLIEGPIANPLILVGFTSPAITYASYPLRGAHGVAAIYNNIATIVPLRGAYGNLNLTLRGDLSLGAHVQSQMAVAYNANANDLPYLGSLVPGSAIAGEAIVQGTDTAIGVSGYVADAFDEQRLSAAFALTPQGVGTIGPLAVRRNGGTLYASYVLDRPKGDSAFWASARNFTLEPARAVSIPGAKLPQLPQFAGHVIDADVAGGGSGADTTVAGRVNTRDLQVAGVRLDQVGVSFAGPLADLSITQVHARGPFGTFDGNGSYDAGGVIARGDFNGNLGALPYASTVGARGTMRGPVAFAYRGNNLIVQTTGAQFSGASMRGIPVESFTGTVGLENGNVHVYSASGRIAGANIVAGGTFGGNGNTVAVATGDAGPEAARALGLPLTAGRVALVGNLGQSGTAQTFDGGVAVSNGVAAGYPVNGSSELHLGPDALNVRDASVMFSGMYGAVNGTIGALRSGAPQYNLNARVPAGDLVTAAHALNKSTYQTVGSFAADLRIGGSGAAPSASGLLQIPAGQLNGMDFAHAQAQINADAGGITVQHGNVYVGTTQTAFDALLRGSNTSIAVRAMHADLSDFNDYFDTGDTLAGTGSVRFSLARTSRTIASAGDVDVTDFRYRRLPIGDTSAEWSSRNGVVNGMLSVGGVHGRLNARGSVGIASAPSLAEIISHSRYNVAAQLHGLDLTTWLPAFGFPGVPVTGRVDATATIAGRYPHLAFASEATLHDGTAGRVPIDLLHMIAHSSGSSIALTHLDLQVPALIASGTGLFGLGARDPISFSMQAESTNLPMLAQNFVRTPVDIHGKLETQFNVEGTWRAPHVTAGINLTNANVRGVVINQLVASLGIHRSSISVRNAEIVLPKGNIAIAGALPLQISPFGLGPPSAPFSMDFISSGADISDFSPLLPAGTKIGGLLNGHVGINGTVDAPLIRGSLALSQGSYVSNFETAPVTQTVARMVFEGTSAHLDMLHAQLGGGTLDANGSITFNRGAAANNVAYNVEATTHRAVLHFPAYGSGTLDSKVHLVKAGGALAQLSGDAGITDAVIPFAALIGGGGAVSSGAVADASAAPGLPFNLGFNLGVTAGKNVAVRASALGFGVDIGAKGHVVLAGTLAQPTLAGAFNAAGGSLTFVDHVFKIQQGTVTFNPSDGVVPQLFAVGTTHVSNVPDNQNPSGAADITIKVTGAATNPQLDFSSDPPGYSRDQIIAMLTPFGALGGLAFDESGNPLQPGQLRGAPLAGNAQPLPPGAIRRQNGAISVGAEAFNILNAQFARSLLTPIENVLGNTLGLSSVNLTLDYTGTVGVSVRRPINDKLAFVYASTFGYPDRQTYGFQYAPNEYTVAQLTFFQQHSPLSFFGSGTSVVSSNPQVTVGQPVTGTSGFTFNLQRLFW